jgi:phosphoglycolate phosphatase-like HAD superfamily hydrolase
VIFFDVDGTLVDRNELHGGLEGSHPIRGYAAVVKEDGEVVITSGAN